MDPALFYDMLRAGELATTSAVNVAAYTDTVEPCFRRGRMCSSWPSPPGCPRPVIPPRWRRRSCGSGIPSGNFMWWILCAPPWGRGLLVWLAAREQKKGRTIEEVRDWAETHKQAVCHQFTVQDLKFLKRGGRITATTAVLGSMLQIKPLLHVDQEGRLTAVGKARGHHASLKTLVDRMEKTVTDEGRETVFISHGDCRGDANKVAEMVRERFGTRDVRINYVGPVIGAHSGPGTLALFYLGTER